MIPNWLGLAESSVWEYFLGCFGEIGGEWICLGVVDLLGIISFFLLSLVVRKLVVGYLKDTNAGECIFARQTLIKLYLQ